MSLAPLSNIQNPGHKKSDTDALYRIVPAMGVNPNHYSKPVKILIKRGHKKIGS